jgi:hypothetical protein
MSGTYPRTTDAIIAATINDLRAGYEHIGEVADAGYMTYAELVAIFEDARDARRIIAERDATIAGSLMAQQFIALHQRVLAAEATIDRVRKTLCQNVCECCHLIREALEGGENAG